MRASTRMNKIAGLAGIIGIVAATAGCGGGGNNSSHSQQAMPSGFVTLQASQIKPLGPGAQTMGYLQPGEEWFYFMSGTTSGSGAVHYIQNGALIRSTQAWTDETAPSVLGAPQLALTDAWDITYGDGSQYISNWTMYMSAFEATGSTQVDYVNWQDDLDPPGGAGTIGDPESAGNNPCQELSGVYYVPEIPTTLGTTGAISGISPFFVPSGSSSSCTLGGGEITNDESVSITPIDTSPEYITAPVAPVPIPVYKSVVSRTFTAEGITENDTEWWSPQLQAFVRREAVINNSLLGTTSNWTYVLGGIGEGNPQASLSDPRMKLPK
ncbi:MAG: hypothetical protein ACLQVD_08635 [Capsulimonadaceae bacterium]